MLLFCYLESKHLDLSKIKGKEEERKGGEGQGGRRERGGRGKIGRQQQGEVNGQGRKLKKKAK